MSAADDRRRLGDHATTVRLRAIGVPVPSAPAVSRKYSAAVMVPPAARSSPVAVTVTSCSPLAGTSAALPLVVCGPGLGQVEDGRADDAPVAGGVERPHEHGVLAGVEARRAPADAPFAGVQSAAVAGIVPVAPVTSTRAEACRSSAMPKPAPTVTASSTTSSAWVTVDPPVVRVAEVGGDRDRRRGRPRGWATPRCAVDTGPTPSVARRRRRRVEEGQHAAEGELLRVGGRSGRRCRGGRRPRRARPWPPARSASSTMRVGGGSGVDRQRRPTARRSA